MGIFQQFPYSNFHELNLDWFLETFKKLAAEWEKTKSDWDSLKDFIDNFFENLDLQNEVNNKLQEMYNDGSLMVLLSNFLTWYVTPEMYGATGDGVTDDTEAVQNAVDSGKSVIFTSKNYKLNTIYINTNDIFLFGNDANLNFEHESGFIIPITGENIDISNFNFQLAFNKDSNDLSNTCIGINGGISGQYFATNIKIHNCIFDGGVFGIASSSTNNLYIYDCEFKSFTYKPIDGAGGYGVLLQSCINWVICE